jgi:hypothetical protein
MGASVPCFGPPDEEDSDGAYVSTAETVPARRVLTDVDSAAARAAT